MSEKSVYWIECRAKDKYPVQITYGLREDARRLAGASENLLIPITEITPGQPAQNNVNIGELVEAALKMFQLMQKQAETLSEVLRVVAANTPKTPC